MKLPFKLITFKDSGRLDQGYVLYCIALYCILLYSMGWSLLPNALRPFQDLLRSSEFRY